MFDLLPHRSFSLVFVCVLLRAKSTIWVRYFLLPIECFATIIIYVIPCFYFSKKLNRRIETNLPFPIANVVLVLCEVLLWLRSKQLRVCAWRQSTFLELHPKLREWFATIHVIKFFGKQSNQGQEHEIVQRKKNSPKLQLFLCLRLQHELQHVLS